MSRVQNSLNCGFWGDPGLIDSVSGCNIEPEESIGYCREEAAEDWGDPGLIDSGSGCNIEPEVSIGYCREEAAEDLYA
jgi:hypothetical protein